MRNDHCHGAANDGTALHVAKQLLSGRSGGTRPAQGVVADALNAQWRG